MTIGEAAQDRFQEIAIRHLSTSAELSNNFNTGHFFDSIKKEFVWMYLKKGETQISQQKVDKLLAAAVKRSKREHKALTYYIPCIVVFSNDPEVFRIGPVEFVRMEKFLQDYNALFEEEKQRIREDHIKRCQEAFAKGSSENQVATPEQSAEFSNSLVNTALDYYKEFRWVAIVSIPECDVNVSRKRAERAIEAALDILKLFFGQLRGERLRQGHSIGKPSNTAKITREIDGKFDFSVSRSSREAPVGKEWFRVLSEPRNNSYLQAAASALNACVDPQYSTHLKERFLDALAWYGQAVSDPQISVQIVKYVAALERLTVTKKLEAGLTETVTRRTALLSDDGTIEGFNKALKDAEKIYDYRSGLMHGSRSPFDKDLELVTPLAEDITIKALFSSLRIFTELSQRIKNAGAKDLETRYLEIESQIQHESQEKAGNE